MRAEIPAQGDWNDPPEINGLIKVGDICGAISIIQGRLLVVMDV